MSRDPDTESAALVIAAHGSQLDPDASTPAFNHADTIRQADLFAEVRETFWKEEPAFREVLRTLESDTVYIVPFFMSEGYFVDRILPREFRLTEVAGLDVDKTVHLTDPVGTHPSMSMVILHRATTVTGDPDVGQGVGLAVVGHGTERHAHSDSSTRAQVATLRSMDRFDEVRALFLDESPYISDIGTAFKTSDVIVVPFFVADGYHTKHDIPRALGLEGGSTASIPRSTQVGDLHIRYTGAVGTDARMASVILERAAEAGAVIPSPPAVGLGDHP